ncbi:hypothetical protein F4819DRAFT_443254 [Hypoxylon fuscum]|nr:hypothetical protein F4819DRAFT_443254 [Hypoxylon fuscum]
MEFTLLLAVGMFVHLHFLFARSRGIDFAVFLVCTELYQLDIILREVGYFGLVCLYSSSPAFATRRCVKRRDKDGRSA